MNIDSPTGKLMMHEFLTAVQDHGLYAIEHLRDVCGYPEKVIVRKAEKAAGHNYTDYGVVVHRCWLTDEGRKFIAERGIS